MEPTGLILLAAGASTRLGQPKQLLEYKGRTFIKQAIDTALQVIQTPVIVVLGANSPLLQNEVSTFKVHVIINDNWKEGMASSIRYGLSGLLEIMPHIDNVILMVCDQPFVSASLIEDLIAERKQTLKGIIACTYKNTLGTPVLFNKNYFSDLLNLNGTEGAKKLISKYLEDVSAVSFPLGFIDIDTVDDYEQLLNNWFYDD